MIYFLYTDRRDPAFENRFECYNQHGKFQSQGYLREYRTVYKTSLHRGLKRLPEDTPIPCEIQACLNKDGSIDPQFSVYWFTK